MFRHKSNGIRIALLVFILAPWCPAAFKPGDPLPALDSYKLEGKLPDTLKGRVILLDFWASWCRPCKESFPAMQELHKQYAGRGLTIIAVNVDEKREDMDRFLKAANVSFTVVRDPGQKLVAAADVPAMPTSFLIDRSGKIRSVHKGFVRDETMKQYQEQIQLLLKEPAP
ncbi:MAG: Redoxin domain protein [Phycisphaerales bacterium]|nr:Redoxin domain protein [Phycisphaerales bacterium]